MMWSTFRRTMLAIQFVHESQQLLGPARERGGRQTVAPSMHPQLVCPKFCLSVCLSVCGGGEVAAEAPGLGTSGLSVVYQILKYLGVSQFGDGGTRDALGERRR